MNDIEPLADGLDALRAEMTTRDIMGLIEKTARWVAPETFRFLPVWYPETARKAPIFKANWTMAQTNTAKTTQIEAEKFEGNTRANKALTLALGLRSNERPNWSCCHIWGIDDAAFQQSNMIVQDPRFYSCVANMVLLPTPLKAFTDAMPEIKMMLRVCAARTYGWVCGHVDVADLADQVAGWQKWDDYPASWPRKLGDPAPIGTLVFSNRVQDAALARKRAIKRDLLHAGPHYPRDQVRDVLGYWKVAL